MICHFSYKTRKVHGSFFLTQILCNKNKVQTEQALRRGPVKLQCATLRKCVWVGVGVAGGGSGTLKVDWEGSAAEAFKSWPCLRQNVSILVRKLRSLGTIFWQLV